MLSRAHLLYSCFPLCEIVPPPCSPRPELCFCSHDGCVYSGRSRLGHTGKLRGVSKFTCPAFQANVFDIEQWNDSARFRSVRLECNRKGKSRSDSNIHLPTTPACFLFLFLFNFPMTNSAQHSYRPSALVGADKCNFPTDRNANQNILLSHVYSEALSQTLHQTHNWQLPGLCWMTLNVQEKLGSFLEKMYSHSLHLPGCNILFLRKLNPWREQRHNEFCR